MAGKQILVVEPSAAEWEFIRDIFKLRDDQAHWARTLSDALEQFRARQFDLILIEVLLSRGSGFALCDKIKSEEAGKKVPVLMMGGVLRNFKFAHDAKVRYHANDVLVKPFEPFDLERKLAFYLDGVILKDDGQKFDATTGAVIHEARDSEEVRLYGLLGETLVPRLLATFWLLEENGILHVQRGFIQKHIHFQKGTVVHVGGGTRRECLQQMLLDRKVISSETLTDSLNRMIDTGKLQGETLMELGALSSHDLFTTLSSQAERKLLNVFSWSEGVYWFEPALDVVPAGMVPLPLDLGRLLRIGVESNLSPATLESFFTERLVMAVHPAEGGTARLERLHPTPAEKRFWAILDGHRTVASLLTNSELSPTDTYRMLYLLDVIGAVAFAAPGAPGRVWPAIDPLNRSAETVDVEFREVCQQRYLQSFQRPLLAVLDISPDASPAEIIAVYLRSCAGLMDEKRYLAADDLTRAKALAVFYRISEAYEIAADPIQRSLHEKAIAEKSELRDTNALQAELCFQKGLLAFSRGDYLEAADLFEAAIESQGRVAEYHAYLGYTIYLRDNERGAMIQSLAIERLKRALEIDPQLPEAHLFLGNIYFFAGKLEKAELAYERAIHYDPDNFEAHQRIWQIDTMRQSAATPTEAPPRSPELQEYQEVIHEYFQRIGVWDYYELLGVDPEVNSGDLRRAYFQLSQQLRPAAMREAVDQLVQEKADEIFQRLTVAYTTLSSETERQEYDRSRTARNDGEPTVVSPEERAEGRRLFDQAQQLFQRGDFKAALTTFQRAYQVDSRQAEYLAWQGWSLYQTSGGSGAMAEKSRAAAKALLRRALAQDPACAAASVFLGHIYLKENKRLLARDRFENALRGDPENLPALRGYRHAVRGTTEVMATDSRGNEVQRLLAGEYLAVAEQNFFDRLGVPRDAAPEQVQAAFQRMIEKYTAEDSFAEPDPVSQKLVDDLVDLYAKAFQVLSNAQLRRGYEQALLPLAAHKPRVPETKTAAPASIRAESRAAEATTAEEPAPHKKEKDFWRSIKEKLLRK